jgi:hypothetical protein
MMVLQNNTNAEIDVPGSYGEVYPTCHDSNRALNMKTEEVSDAEEEEPVPITFVEVKAEPEVSQIPLYVHC